MALEDLTGPSKYISDFVKENPDGTTDFVAELDNHVRGVKNAILNTFPNINGPTNATPAELNALAGAAAFMLTFLQAGNKNASLQALGYENLEGNQGKVPFVNTDQNGFYFDDSSALVDSQGTWAWGVVDSDGTLLSEFRVASSSRTSLGLYRVTMDVSATTSPYVVILTAQTPLPDRIRTLTYTIINQAVFDVEIRNAAGNLADNAFGFVVYN